MNLNGNKTIILSFVKERPMALSPGEIMTIEELAEYLKVSKSTLYKLVQNGGLPAQKIGKQWRFSKSAANEAALSNFQKLNVGLPVLIKSDIFF